jgi:hypothetical protein
MISGVDVVTSSNESIVFLGTGAFAGDTNPGAKNQKYEI